MKHKIALGALLMGLASVAVHAESNIEPQYIRSYRMGACDFWSYSNEAKGYVCSSYPSSVSVPDSYSVEEENRQLQSKIDELERRIEALEKKPN